jgi:hypothetical protein
MVLMLERMEYQPIENKKYSPSARPGGKDADILCGAMGLKTWSAQKA